MRCERCGADLTEQEATNYQGKVLCEDCCFDLMNPPKTCDPTAVSSTLQLRKQLGQKGTQGLSELQKKIYHLVMERGKISREEVASTLNLKPEELEREFATLRHCELLRGHKEGNTVYLMLF